MSACAYYDSGDRTLYFIENTGGWTNGQVIGTKTYYTGFETEIYDHRPWHSMEHVVFNIEVNPRSTRYWFYNCQNLEDIQNLNKLNTSQVTTMTGMFTSCHILRSLDLSSFDTSQVTNMYMMFEDCQYLTFLDLSSFDTSLVFTMDDMFRGDGRLKYIRISETWSTSSVTSGSSMFYGCNLPHYNGRTSATMAYAGIRDGVPGYLSDSVCAYYDSTDQTLNFIGCYEGEYTNEDVEGTKTYYTGFEDATLETAPVWIDKPFTAVNFNVMVKPKTTYKWFYNCTSLTAINNLQLLNTSNVTNMSRMFTECTHLTSLDLSHFNTSNVTNMSRMFFGCRVLTSLDLSNFNTSNVTNMVGMFRDCWSLTSLDLSNFDTSNVTSMSYMFCNCRALTPMLWSNDNDKYKKTQDSTIDHTKNYYIFNIIDDKFKKVDNPIQENIENYYEFFGFNTQKVTDMSYMFEGCNSLISLDFSSFDTSNVTNMDYMFEDCNKLISLDLSSFNTLNVTSMEYMFEYCRSLTLLDLSSFNMLNVISMTHMFEYCSAEIPVLYLDTIHYGTSIFTNSTGKIYLVRRNSEEDENNGNVIRNDWRNYIAQNNYTNVHFEYDDSTRPTALLVLNRGKFENNEWEADEENGGVIKIELHLNVYNDNKADDEYLAPNSIKSVTAIVNKDNYIKNTDYTVDYRAVDDLIYLTLLTSPSDQYDITVTIVDKSDIPVNFTTIIPGIFAMIEFKAGGHGMSIGKICERDGLEVSIPTTIGKGLLPPVDQQGNFDLTNYQLVIGKYNEQKNDPLFVIGNGTDDTHRSNLMEVGNNSIIIGNINNTHTVIDGNGQRIYANDGTTQLASFNDTVAQIGKSSSYNLKMVSTQLQFFNSDTKLGYVTASGYPGFYLTEKHLDTNGNPVYNDTSYFTEGSLRLMPKLNGAQLKGRTDLMAPNSDGDNILRSEDDNGNVLIDLYYDESNNKAHLDLSGNINIPSGATYNINNTSIFDLIYPVGSIYMSVNSTSPQTLFGGKWTPLQNRFLFAAGSFHTAGTEGGSRYIQAHTHSFTGASHNHSAGTNMAFVRYNYGVVEKGLGERVVAAASSGNYTAPVVNDADVDYAYAQYTGSETAGGTVGAVTGATTGLSGSTAEGNMPPYLTVYMWKRTA